MARTGSSTGLDKKTANILQTLHYLSKEQRAALLKTADRKLVKAICECALNILSGNIKISRALKNKLTKHKNILRRMVCKKNRSWKAKKRLIVQKGQGVVPLILSSLIPTLISALIK